MCQKMCLLLVYSAEKTGQGEGTLEEGKGAEMVGEKVGRGRGLTLGNARALWVPTCGEPAVPPV